MQIIVSVVLIGLLWMVYDLINAPKVDDDENFVEEDTELTQDSESADLISGDIEETPEPSEFKKESQSKSSGKR